MKKGFTLIEVLVASLLMGMLIVILTMVFNSASIAWRTGKAGVANMNEIRWDLSAIQKLADNFLPCVHGEVNKTETGLIVSAWEFSKGTGRGAFRTRGFINSSMGYATSAERKRYSYANSKFGVAAQDSTSAHPWYRLQDATKGSTTSGKSSYTIGVTSAGPNRKFGDEDDITTWPEGVQ